MTGRNIVFALLCVPSFVVLGIASEYRFAVVDEETREPMEGVPVEVRVWCKGTKYAVPYDRTTDTNGMCHVSKKNVNSVNVLIRDDITRYSSSLWLKSEGIDEECVTTIGVRRISAPISLIVKEERYSHRDTFGMGDGVLKYDFFTGSYLPPLGTGTVADVEFRRMPIEKLGNGKRTTHPGETPSMRQRETMMVVFTGADDGVVRVPDSPQSNLRLRMAPDDGYIRTYTCIREDGPHLENIRTWDDNKTLCFRIRTRRNEKGEIVEAYYGKIYGDISFDIANDIRIGSPHFLYYLNPRSMDTNLEYDGRHNLRPGARRNDYNP
jgi:hypothetical protein